MSEQETYKISLDEFKEYLKPGVKFYCKDVKRDREGNCRVIRWDCKKMMFLGWEEERVADFTGMQITMRFSQDGSSVILNGADKNYPDDVLGIFVPFSS